MLEVSDFGLDEEGWYLDWWRKRGCGKALSIVPQKSH